MAGARARPWDILRKTGDSWGREAITARRWADTRGPRTGVPRPRIRRKHGGNGGFGLTPRGVVTKMLASGQGLRFPSSGVGVL